MYGILDGSILTLGLMLEGNLTWMLDSLTGDNLTRHACDVTHVINWIAQWH